MKHNHSMSNGIMPTHAIQFTQNSIAEYFENGQSLEDVTRQLAKKVIKPEHFPSIRVVKYKNQWWSLDNRRLRVFKNAFIDQISVIICNLNDTIIHKEFFSKKTNKSLKEGGSIRTLFTKSLDQQHFEEGSYIFTKKVLNWNLEQFKYPLPQLSRLPHLSSSYDDRSLYFNSFLNPILEDARATIQSHLETLNYLYSPIVLTLQKIKLANRFENPSTLILSKGPAKDFDVKSGDAVLLQSYRHPDLKFIGLISYKKEDIELQNNMKAKIVIDENQREYFRNAFHPNSRWKGWHLGSLITHSRMYDVCTAMPKTIFEEQLLTGNIESWGWIDHSIPAKSQFDLKENTAASSFSQLNHSQQTAINKFLKLSTGVCLIEGPPGTGKTKTLIALLEILSKRGERVLVSAPSNKAVQLIASQFMQLNPHAPTILVGVEEKLTDDPQLQKIFIHTWASQYCNRLASLVDQLKQLLPADNEKLGFPDFILELEIEQSYEDMANQVITYQLPELMMLHERLDRAVKKYQNIIEQIYIKLDKCTSAARQIGLQFLSEVAIITDQIIVKIQGSLDDDSKQSFEGQLLNSAKIIFSTLSVAGRKMFKEMNPVHTLIVDEAAQAIEPEILIGLFSKPKKLLLIGDTNQLPATVISSPAKQLGYDRSLMWRLIKERRQPYSLLTTQYRMHPQIREWPSKRYYDSAIQDHDEIKNGSRIMKELIGLPFLSPYSFININSKEEKQNRSFANLKEVAFIKATLDYLSQFYEIDVVTRVGIITFYKSQVEALFKHIAPTYPNIKIQTVDGFQGGESDFIIVSFVRSNSNGQVGFLNDFRRLNVALTRARYSLIMVGHAATLEKNNDDLKDLIQHAKQTGCFFKIESIPYFSKEGSKKCSPHIASKNVPKPYSDKANHNTFFAQKKSDRKNKSYQLAFEKFELRKPTPFS